MYTHKNFIVSILNICIIPYDEDYFVNNLPEALAMHGSTFGPHTGYDPSVIEKTKVKRTTCIPDEGCSENKKSHYL